jgi:hypothetical protein
MRDKLFGLQWQADTQKAITILEDSKKIYDFVDIGDTGSALMDAVVTLSGNTELPQLYSEGVTYVGIESVQAYCRK